MMIFTFIYILIIVLILSLLSDIVKIHYYIYCIVFSFICHDFIFKNEKSSDIVMNVYLYYFY